MTLNEPVNHRSIDELLTLSRAATRQLSQSSTAQRNDALEAIAQCIEQESAEILEANAEDTRRATEAKMSVSLLDRLLLTPERVKALASSVRAVISLPDPLNEERDLGVMPNGIAVSKRRVPLGVIAVVYEARPNVTVECAALTIKSGNALVLRGGKEALSTNSVLAQCVREGLGEAAFNSNAVQLVTDISRDRVAGLLGAVGRVDLCIPRGGPSLMQMVDEFAKVPVIRHGQGIVHVFIDEHANPDMARDIAVNSKVARPGVCNAAETLLIHSKWLSLWPNLATVLAQKSVELRCDPRALAAVEGLQLRVSPKQAVESDWGSEYLDLIYAVKTVDTLDEALDHIARYGSGHTASVVTDDPSCATQFLTRVEASCVLHNASTRFNDGGQLGLGAEIGISTSRMHAWGPMGLRELTAEKFVVRGSGQTRG